MCGRYAMEIDPSKLKSLIEEYGFKVDAVKDEDKVSPSLNVPPQAFSMIYCQTKDDKGQKHNELQAMKWTLQPSYVHKPVKYPSFNTRSESLDPLKPAWKCAKEHRGIVFMQGYYEWHTTNKKTKIPHYIYHPDSPLLACLVVWDTNYELNDVPTFSIVTTPASKNLSEIHDRMPVIARSFEAARSWVSDDWPDALQIIKPNPSLRNYLVSKDVNKVGVNRPGLNKPDNPQKMTDFFSKKRNARETHKDADEAPQAKSRRKVKEETK